MLLFIHFDASLCKNKLQKQIKQLMKEKLACVTSAVLVGLEDDIHIFATVLYPLFIVR